MKIIKIEKFKLIEKKQILIINKGILINNYNIINKK